MAGKTLERCLVKVDPFNVNQCSNNSCLPAKNTKNKIICKSNNEGYKILVNFAQLFIMEKQAKICKQEQNLI